MEGTPLLCPGQSPTSGQPVSAPDYITKQELAAMLRVTTRTITNYVRGQALPAPAKFGRKALWPRAELLEFLRRQTGAQSA